MSSLSSPQRRWRVRDWAGPRSAYGRDRLHVWIGNPRIGARSEISANLAATANARGFPQPSYRTTSSTPSSRIWGRSPASDVDRRVPGHPIATRFAESSLRNTATVQHSIRAWSKSLRRPEEADHPHSRNSSSWSQTGPSRDENELPGRVVRGPSPTRAPKGEVAPIPVVRVKAIGRLQSIDPKPSSGLLGGFYAKAMVWSSGTTPGPLGRVRWRQVPIGVSCGQDEGETEQVNDRDARR